jgi:hypothetical protein
MILDEMKQTEMKQALPEFSPLQFLRHCSVVFQLHTQELLICHIFKGIYRVYVPSFWSRCLHLHLCVLNIYCYNLPIKSYYKSWFAVLIVLRPLRRRPDAEGLFLLSNIRGFSMPFHNVTFCSNFEQTCLSMQKSMAF